MLFICIFRHFGVFISVFLKLVGVSSLHFSSPSVCASPELVEYSIIQSVIFELTMETRIWYASFYVYYRINTLRWNNKITKISFSGHCREHVVDQLINAIWINNNKTNRATYLSSPCLSSMLLLDDLLIYYFHIII